MDDTRWTTEDGGAALDVGPGVRQTGRIYLAHLGPLRLGPLHVEPALRRVSTADGREEFIQPRVMQVLVALAQAQGDILSRDDLLGSCWHGVVVGEDAIDRVIGRLRRLCEQFADEELRLETIPRVGYRLIAPALSAPSPVSVSGPAPLGPPAPTEPVLAVLAFDNLSGDPDFRYFADGISEEILLTVAKTTGMKVIGRSSSFQFRGADKSARHVAAELGVTHILDGAVRRSGDSLRISAELVDCATQTCLWSDRFDRDLANVFTLQDEIAASVAEAMKARFAPSPTIGPIDPVAYDLYLRARDQGPDRIGFDTELLEQATEIAPDFAQAWALLAFARAIDMNWLLTNEPHTEAHPRVIEAAERALALDPSSAYAYMALEMAEPVCGHYAKRGALLEKSLASAANDPMVLVHAAGLADVLGYQRLAYGYVARAYELDPRRAAFYYPWLLEGIGLHREARAAMDHEVERWPDSVALRTLAIRFAYESGDWERYDREMANLPEDELDKSFFHMLSRVAERFRRWSPQAAEAFLAELRDSLEATGTVALSGLGFPASQGLQDEIYELLDQASFAHLHDIHGRLMLGEVSLNILFTPLFSHLRRDVRFVKLCARLGLVDHWVRTDRWPDFLTEVAPYYDLKAEAKRLYPGPRG
ncbi:MAG: winged helix-turn-helix domain-containing protein [Phenylobacterium sp.]